jgi:exodeoxyribonuclease VII large subunit
MGDKQIFTLSQVTSSIRKTIEQRYTQSYWVKAEMHKLNRFPSGHAFPELVQKEGEKIIAQVNGIIWKQNLDRINTLFIQTVKEPLKDGVSLLLLVKINYSETYGLSLQILDIDPSFSLGELQKQRDETLRKLQELGILNQNQQCEFPLLPKRIAVISADSSKGLSDFMEILNFNEEGYSFFTFLFPAYLQGDMAVSSIIQALNKILKVQQFFDLVVIVRGGGAEVSMTCYNNFELCKAIAEFPLPVMTGIGHSTNLTVAEMISYRNAITPTKLAEYLVQIFREFDQNIKNHENKILSFSKNYLLVLKNEFEACLRLFKNVSSATLLQSNLKLRNQENLLLNATNKCVLKHQSNLEKFNSSFAYQVKYALSIHEKNLFDIHSQLNQRIKVKLDYSRMNLNLLENTVRNLDPQNVLKRGFSLTMFNGKTINELNLPMVGDEITTITAQNILKSTVQENVLKSED